VEKPKEIAQPTGTGVVRFAKVTAGCVLLPVGVALLVLPGPGIPVVALSLMLLEDEFRWAGKAREGMTDLSKRGFDWVREKAWR
jgi:hypothetical protein